MEVLNRWYWISVLGCIVMTLTGHAQSGIVSQHGMRIFPDSNKFTVASQIGDIACPFSKDGWYYSQAGVESTKDGLVCVYRRSDFHTATSTDIMVAYSNDEGKTWQGHHSIAHADIWNEHGCWVAPQLSKTKEGRLIIIADFGNRTSGQDWPMLAHWQKSNRGMSNHLFWSDDQGKTWEGPTQIDNVGGEPGYIMETTDGDLLYTRTQSKVTDMLWKPPLPWGPIYYYNEAVISTDGGATWPITSIVGDDPHIGDCEVGVVSLDDQKLLAISRVGMGNGAFGQPSRFIYSHDNGRSWEDHHLSPVYAQRPIVHQLHSGKLLVTYRNRWGTPGTYALVFDAEEKLPYEPASYLFDENRCRLENGVLKINTDEGIKNLVTFTFYPAQDPASDVDISVRLKVNSADINGCNISAGCYVRIQPDRVSLGDDPDVYFMSDGTRWHDYRIIRAQGMIKVFVDDVLKLEHPSAGLETRMVQIGNRQTRSVNFYKIDEKDEQGWSTHSSTEWSSMRVKVDNKSDYDIDWQWDSSKGYPDQFRRDRIVLLDRIASSFGHSGYSGWTQLENGKIVIADYTVGGNGNTPAKMPFIRAYLADEKFLSNN